MYLPCTCHRIWDPNKRSSSAPKRTLNCGESVEPMTGIEPAYSAWEADVLPLNYIGVAADRTCFHRRSTCFPNIIRRAFEQTYHWPSLKRRRVSKSAKLADVSSKNFARERLSGWRTQDRWGWALPWESRTRASCSVTTV